MLPGQLSALKILGSSQQKGPQVSALSQKGAQPRIGTYAQSWELIVSFWVT